MFYLLSAMSITPDISALGNDGAIRTDHPIEISS